MAEREKGKGWLAHRGLKVDVEGCTVYKKLGVTLS